jgi:hypothetical protein
MKWNTSKKVVNPQWQPFVFLSRDLRQRASFASLLFWFARSDNGASRNSEFGTAYRIADNWSRNSFS